MDTRSVYITVTLVILANGGVLTAVLGDLPNPSAQQLAYGKQLLFW